MRLGEHSKQRESHDTLSSGHSSKRSLISGDSVEYSAHTTASKQTNVTASTSATFPLPGSSLVSPIGNGTRRKPKLVAATGSKTKSSNVPPLEFASAGLVGREKEVTMLKSCHDRLMKDGTRELILVGGESGVGKSSVIERMESEVSIEGLFVKGKFDMNTSNEPYSGLAKAFGIICNKLKEAGLETIAELKQDLRKELGDKPGLLVQLIPELRDILVIDSCDDAISGSIGKVDEAEGGFDRLRFAFRVLARVFSSVFSPLVLFLDDLHWADVSSLQVLEFVISDTQNENPLMIIGGYRCEELNENSLLHIKMVSLREKTHKFQFQMTEMMIESFRVSEVEKIITSVLPSLRADHIVGLATLCHKRTLGNPFFTIEFLKMLHFEDMLAFDFKTKTWSWSLSDIEQDTMSTANVVAMLERHLRKLPQQVQALLQCAAYLRSSFSEPTIDLVWSTYGRKLVETKVEPVSWLLQLLVTDRIFEKGDSTKQYRWAHDKLQEAALSLSGKRRQTFQLDIGKTLYYGLTKEQVEEDLFTIVDLVNNGNISKRPEFASMNLRAAEKAREVSAFQAASEYAAEGISLLQESDWIQTKSVALSLYTIGAEAELMLGDIDVVKRYRETVLSRTDLSSLEMLPLQISKAKALGDVELKSKEAMEFYLKLLKNLGFRLVWSRSLAFPQAAIGAIRTIKKAKAKPQSFYESMEASSDTKQKFIAYLLSKTAYNAYVTGNTAFNLLCSVNLAESTLEFGVNEFSASTFTFIGIMAVMVLQDYEAMERFVNVALGMLKKFRGMRAAEPIYVGYQLGLLWVKPLEAARAKLEEAIIAGRREGDLVSTGWSIVLHATYLPYTTGRPIRSILDRYPTIISEFEETKSTAQLLNTKKYKQMLLNLSDASCCDNPSVLLGEVYTDTREDYRGNTNLAETLVAEGELVFWNEDYEVSAKRALKVGETYAKLAPANFMHQIESFHRAVSLYAVAIQKSKRSYKSAANKIRKQMAKMKQYGNTTIHYYYMFLTAENLRFKKHPKEAQLKYEEALQAVGKLGHLHHLGLFNERYSDFLLRDLSLEKESRYRLEQAIGYYKEWGAFHKVKALESRLQDHK